MDVVVTDEMSSARPEEQSAMTTEENDGPALLLGPMLRYVGETEATIWVETDRECQVEVLGRRVPTFEVAGHHYGLVVLEGLTPGSEQEYGVALDGTVCWPPRDNDFPPSVLRTLAEDRPARLAFGSCRVAEIAQQNLDRPARRERARRQRAEGGYAPAETRAAPAETGQAGNEGTDALVAFASMLSGSTPNHGARNHGARDRWPDVLLMIGDQVYADEPGPATRSFIAAHRAGQPDSGASPGEVADFEEYCALYREAWSDPAVRWLLSVVPTAMIFDDHDVHDDWNISASWRRDYTAKPWWGTRIEAAFQSYWVYQHLGNLSPAELATDKTWGKVRRQGDAAPVLAELARRADRREPGVRWSFARTFTAATAAGTGDTAGNPPADTDGNAFDHPARNTTANTAGGTTANTTGGTTADTTGGTIANITGGVIANTTGGKIRVAMLDSRSRRVVEGTRLMADDAEWRWLTESLTGDWAHVVIATSVPPLLPRGIHTLEAWTERVCAGAWGRRAVGLGERLRRRFDLEHWPSFGASFGRLEALLAALGDGRLSPRGAPPATVTIISGDVHHSYLTAVDLNQSAATRADANSATRGDASDETGGNTNSATRREADRPSTVYQAVCSPFHQAMPPSMRGAQGLASTKASGLVGTAVASRAGARVPKLSWHITDGPWFDNMLATLTYAGRKAIIRFDRAVTDQDGPRLTPVLETDLS